MAWDGRVSDAASRYVIIDTPLACAPKLVLPPQPKPQPHKCAFDGVDFSSTLTRTQQHETTNL